MSEAKQSDSTDLLGPVAWRYVPSEVWADHVLTDDPERTKLAREYGRKVDALYTEEQMLARVAAERGKLIAAVGALHMAQTVNNQNHPSAWHDGVNAAIDAMRET